MNRAAVHFINRYLCRNMLFKLRMMFCVWLLAGFAESRSQNLQSEVNAVATSYDMMGGAVVTFCESGILESCYFGKADLVRNLAVSAQTKFRIASISKSITALAIMQLKAQGLLNIDQNISTLLGYPVTNPSYPGVAITARMLLSHTSSIVDGNTYAGFLNATYTNNPIPDLNEILTPGGAFYSSSTYNSIQPGTYFNYSNLNYVILGTLVEKASNMRFDVYCRQMIFQPLGVDASFNVNDLADIDSVAVLYRKINSVWTPQADDFQGTQPVFSNLTGYAAGTNGGRFGPQGGLRISAHDLATLFLCLANAENGACMLIDSASFAEMKSNQWTYNGSNGNNYFGLFRSWGLGIHRLTGTAGNDVVLPGSTFMYGHTGEAYGLVSDAYYDETRKAGFVFITNGTGAGYSTNSTSAYYTVEQDIFGAIESFGNIQSCSLINELTHHEQENRLHAFPNPGTGMIRVQCEGAEAAGLLLELFTPEGRKLLEQHAAGNGFDLEASSLAVGVYLLRVKHAVAFFIKPQ